MLRSSEWVSVGHPDKMCDMIVSNILDKWKRYDSSVRFALECVVKDNSVHLCGEVSSKVTVMPFQFEKWARDAVSRCGYTRKYQELWGRENVPCAHDMDFTVNISEQSPDIAKGVADNEAWGDQGIFWGMATPDSYFDYMPRDIWLARRIGERIYKSECCGIDVKTLVEWDDTREMPELVIVAAPTMTDDDTEAVERLAIEECEAAAGFPPKKVIVNGTGRFVRHGSMADTGVTGRKLCVDLYGGNCEIGGGSLWGKDYTKADVTLNAYARYLAKKYAKKHRIPTKVALSCCIGRPEFHVTVYSDNNAQILSSEVVETPEVLASRLGLKKANCYTRMCMGGMPYVV